jgi:uncharacterized protein (DUF302 family)
MPSDFFSRQIAAPFGVPFFLRFIFAGMLFCGAAGVSAEDDVTKQFLASSDFQSAHDALIETVEAEGLVVSAVIPFNGMLARTAKDLAQGPSPFAEAEIVQFCSSALAWQMVTEEASQLSLCPLSIAIYAKADEPGKVMLAYRSPGRSSPARAKADELLRRLAERAAGLARLRW